MRLVIDLQGAQSTGNRSRGIGRYSMSLAKGLIRNRGDHEVLIALNGYFWDMVDHIRAEFDGLLPQENIRVWSAPGPVNALDAAHDARRLTAELIREQFLASLSPDAVLVSSLFEGGDDTVTSVGALSSEVFTAVILYDLIPLINRNTYLQDPVVERWYENKLDHLRRADLLLAISKSSGKEAIDYLGPHPRQVVNISTAADAHFTHSTVTSKIRDRLAEQYGLDKPFVMYTGSVDQRKNLEGLIAAYSRLPVALRCRHQLAVVCSIGPTDRERLIEVARAQGLKEGELILTGFVPEEDLLWCYRACKLFIFPSWHEGFGLPALEAMHCGRAVIAANTSSLPEVIGREDALFDPFDPDAIAGKMAQVLEDDTFRADLERHGPVQARKFSWDKTAARAWRALEASATAVGKCSSIPSRRPRLAYLSPLLPVAIHAAEYSAELLPELARHYRVEVIVAQEQVTDAYVRGNCTIRSVEWFRQHAHEFDRVLYHFGNSPSHAYMLDLLRDHAGVVMLHDFFLSSILANHDGAGQVSRSLVNALLASHGWSAVKQLSRGGPDVACAYPGNLEVLQGALGIIVHSDFSRQLANRWYGPGTGDDWRVIPLMRKRAGLLDRTAARSALGLPDDVFVVCSFGHIGPSTLNHRLLAAWAASPLAGDPRCRLVFVGQNDCGEYGAELVRLIRAAAGGTRIEITGWTDRDAYHQWLVAANVGVQLSTLSPEGNSDSLLDCMNYGLATVVNGNWPAAELDQHAVCILPEDFNDHELVEALTALHSDRQRCYNLGEKAQEVIAERHCPRLCAEMYRAAIEGYYNDAAVGTPGLVAALAAQSPAPPPTEWPLIANAIAKNSPKRPRRKQLLLDVSELVNRDANSGIQRVVRAILSHFLQNSPLGWQVEPVYATMEEDGYRYARRFASRFLGTPKEWATDEPVEAYQGDIFLGLDLQPSVVPRQVTVLHDWHRRGVGIHFVVYDLVPVLMPDVFPDGAKDGHHRWLETVTQFDSAICISQAVADELEAWLKAHGSKREMPFAVNWFHLGGDTDSSVPTAGMPVGALKVLAALNERPSFLCVSTLEPRKGQSQILSAFETLWAKGINLNLVIVGKQGWMVEDLVERLHSHTELGKRLHWLAGISDEYLEKVYAGSTCLIAASEGEGFGLPLIEAVQHKLPIIARDIRVFREVAGGHAFYFPNNNDPHVLAQAVEAWLALHYAGKAPQSDAMPWLRWAQSADMLLDCLIGHAAPYRQWRPDGALRLWGDDHRLHTEVGKRHRCSMQSTGAPGFLVFGPYLPQPAGYYSLRAWGGGKFLVGNEYIDLSSDRASEKHCHVHLTKALEGWHVEIDVYLPSAVADLECRLWVDAASDIWLDGIELIPAGALGSVAPEGPGKVKNAARKNSPSERN